MKFRKSYSIDFGECSHQTFINNFKDAFYLEVKNEAVEIINSAYVVTIVVLNPDSNMIEDIESWINCQ